MGTYYGTYQTDLGRDIYATRVTTRFVQGPGVEVVPDEADLLPASFLAALGEVEGPCSLPVTPRRARLYLSDILQFDLPLPFRGGTPEYQQLLTEIEALPSVVTYDILPEVTPANQIELMIL